MREERTKEKQVGQRFTETLKSTELGDLSRDYAELGIDTLLDETLRELPVVKTIWAIGSVGRKIQDFFLTKKVWSFLFQLKDVPENDRVSFLEKITDDQNYGEKVTDILLILLDRFNHTYKAEVFGRLFRNTIEKNIEYSDFLRLSYILELSFVGDLLALEKSWNGAYLAGEISDQITTLGLTSYNYAAHYDYEMGRGEEPKNELTDLGKLLMEFGIEDKSQL